MIDTSQLRRSVDEALNERFHLATVDGAASARCQNGARYCERVIRYRDEKLLVDEITHAVAKRAKPGDTTVFWRIRPETNRGQCYFRFCVGRAP
jgi:hypothetical protein